MARLYKRSPQPEPDPPPPMPRVDTSKIDGYPPIEIRTGTPLMDSCSQRARPIRLTLSHGNSRRLRSF